VTLLGPSGCGKTTTLRLIAGFIAPDAGTIVADGRLLSSAGQVVPPEERGMGMVFQSYAVWPHRTVFENVVFGLKLRRVGAAEARERVKRALALVNLTGLQDRLPGELSGGQQQRVAVARALVTKPAVVFADEPTGNLDSKASEDVLELLRQAVDEFDQTVIMVTHDPEAASYADRLLTLRDGRIVSDAAPGTADEVIELMKQLG
jgi:iron(III) transport system ATP-binding protein